MGVPTSPEAGSWRGGLQARDLNSGIHGTADQVGVRIKKRWTLRSMTSGKTRAMSLAGGYAYAMASGQFRIKTSTQALPVSGAQL